MKSDHCLWLWLSLWLWLWLCVCVCVLCCVLLVELLSFTTSFIQSLGIQNKRHIFDILHAMQTHSPFFTCAYVCAYTFVAIIHLYAQYASDIEAFLSLTVDSSGSFLLFIVTSCCSVSLKETCAHSPKKTLSS